MYGVYLLFVSLMIPLILFVPGTKDILLEVIGRLVTKIL